MFVSSIKTSVIIPILPIELRRKRDLAKIPPQDASVARSEHRHCGILGVLKLML